MVLWNFDLLWENYGTFEKTMVLWKKKTMVHYTENYGTSIYEGKKHCRLPKTKKLPFIMEKPKVKYQKN